MTEHLLFYKYDYDSGIFVEDLQSEYLNFKKYPKGSYLKNLVANDINDDGYLDLIITIYNYDTDKIKNEIHLYNPNKKYFEEVFSSDISGIFIGDFDGDRQYFYFM